jgi:hypothetical protein
MLEQAASALVTLAGRVAFAIAWALVLVLATFIVVTLMHVGHDSSLLAADERLARAIASPFSFLDGLNPRYGWL